MFLPKFATCLAYERSNQVRCNPAAVKMAGLWLDQFPFDKTLIHPLGIKCYVISNCSVRRCWIWIVPGCIAGNLSASFNRVIRCLTLPFTVGAARGGNQELH